MIFLIIGLVLAIFMCRLGGDKNESSPPKPATLGRYIRHEHLLLSIIWSGRIIKYYDRHYMNRSRRLVLFVDVFLLNFIVAAIVFSASQPSDIDIDCGLLHYCSTSCQALQAPNECAVSPLRVGHDDDASNYRFPYLPNSPQYGNCSTFVSSSPCFPSCRTSSRKQYYIDTRPRCRDVDSSTRSDLLCLLPAAVPVCTNVGLDVGLGGASATIPTEFDTEEIILRTVLTVLIVFPASYILKALMRYTSRAEGCCSCFKRSIAFVFIIVILALAVIVALIFLEDLQDGELVGTVTLSFLFAFLVGLLLEFPKLAFVYVFWRKKKYAERFIYCYNIYLIIQRKKAKKRAKGKGKGKGKGKDSSKKGKGKASSKKPSRPAPVMKSSSRKGSKSRSSRSRSRSRNSRSRNSRSRNRI